MKLDLSLARKYSRPGPRYTSYPTAPHFGPEVGSAEYLAELGDPQVPVTADFSLYVHLPFCRSRCYFCACNVLITSHRDQIAAYLELLKKEIDLLAERLGSERQVGQLHWGGGTPTYLTAGEIEDLMGHLRSRFTFSPDAEISIEIDPREFTTEQAAVLAETGFNRASCGVQDFALPVQEAINRRQSYELTYHVLESLRSHGIRHINLDLIYGLPFQTEASFSRTLDEVLTLQPDRLAVYSYAYLPNLKKQQQLIDPKTLPEPQLKLALLSQTIARLTEKGALVYIGMDHFARPGDELALALENGGLQRNFQGYSTRAGLDMYGLGMTSIGQTHNYYIQNHKRLSDYRSSVNTGRLPVERGIRLTAEDHLRRQVIHDIMCRFEIDIPSIEASRSIDFRQHFARELPGLEPFAEDGLLVDDGDRIRVTEAGRLFIRNIAMTFDAYLPAEPGGPVRSQSGRTGATYSATV